MATTRTMTIEELAQLPEDEGRFELLDGEPIEMTPASFAHGKYAARLARFLGNIVEPAKLGIVCGAETGFVLHRNPDRLLAPDVSFVRQEHVPPEDEQFVFLELAPDLAVEVISPSESWTQVEGKAQAYIEAGVRLVWLVDPRRRVVVEHTAGHEPRTLIGNAILDGGAVVPGFRLKLEDLFA